VDSAAFLMDLPHSTATDRQTGVPWDHPDIMATIDEMINKHYLKKQLTPVSIHPVSGSTLLLTDAETSPLEPLPEKFPPKPYASNRYCGFKKLKSTPTIKQNKQKVWKPRQTHPKLTLGMDVGLTEACNLALCALVGRLAYKDKSNQSLEDWIAAHGSLY
jgi:hypothetical protein